jgi:hypothetical protein
MDFPMHSAFTYQSQYNNLFSIIATIGHPGEYMHLTKAITFELQDKLWTLLKVLEAFKVIKELHYAPTILTVPKSIEL